ncbi:acyltransferase [Actinoplanes sp. TBRC 11911]|uniref:acyltransferase family protein n=1 Tax=Actinoplanes sp. TBRC 11911 TaxID=2729386 RepID=UPI00145E3B30|nr:acyltransferase family protein [Actinoplanes sp. TBRC 11911]NMO52565.1 acyltransferase [Actinoplanes sp. TBRC 11911]
MRTGEKRADIEGLRGIAVLLVVLAHAGVPWLAGGYVGVDVFFVISGFLITTLLLREAEATGRISVRRFYARRALRLLPAAAVVLVGTLVGARLFLPVTRLGEFVKDALSAIGYVANLRFAHTGTDYLNADQAPSPFQHFWSLAVEEQFYLVWPLLILAVAYLWRHRRPLAVVLAVLVVASFTLSVTETVRSAPWAYFGPHTRAWELGAGALLALAKARIPRAFAWLGYAAILAAAVAYDDATAYPGWRAAIPVLGTLLVIAAAGRAVVPALGRFSYGWYLWHWPLLTIGPVALGWSGTVAQKLVLAAVALGLAAVSYRWVENPIRYSAKPVLGMGFSAVAAAFAVLLVLLPHPVAVGERRADLRTALSGEVLTRAIAAAHDQKRLPANLTPKLTRARADRPPVWGNGCHADVPVTVAPPGCVFGDPAATTTVVLYGDSHAAHWFPAMERLAGEHHWRLVSLTKSACTAADVPVRHDILKREYTECTAFHRSALARIQTLKPSLVVVGSSFNYDLARPEADQAKQWRAAWDRTFTALAGTGAQVAAIADTPYMGMPVPECLAQESDIGKCTRSLHSSLRGPAQRRVFLAYAGTPSATVINPIDWFCDDACPAVIGNILVYRDSNHMTTTYARALAPLLDARLPVLSQ